MMHFLPPPPPTENAYIRADGSIEPSTLPIKREGRMYTFTNEIFNYTLEVQCDNVVIDGAGFALQGIDDHTGITLSNRRKVTIKNMNISQFDVCISITKSSNIIIMENNMSHKAGIEFDYSNYCQIVRNSMSNHVYGSTSFSNIVGNTFTGAAYVQIGGDNNTISENRFKGDATSIKLSGSHSAKHNTISNNTIEAGGGDGINLSPDSIFNTVYGNNITGKSCGIKIRCSHDNTVHENYLANNGYGIYLENPRRFQDTRTARSHLNTFYHNNLTDNTENVHIETTSQGDTFPNFWDNGKEGNYWSDYNGTDANGDGIGDVPYILNSNNTDNYPFCARAALPIVPAALPIVPAALPIVPIAVSVAAAAVVSAGLLVYLKKRKRALKGGDVKI
jgi:nitrous oxidase accessory protein NosD